MITACINYLRIFSFVQYNRNRFFGKSAKFVGHPTACLCPYIRDFRDFDLSLPGVLNPVFADPFASPFPSSAPSRRSLCLPQGSFQKRHAANRMTYAEEIVNLFYCTLARDDILLDQQRESSLYFGLDVQYLLIQG
jgi:hypothetical protein